MRKGMVKGLMIVMACVAIAALAMPMETWAQAAPAPTPSPSAAPAGNAIKPPSNCDGYVGLTHHIAGCIRETVDAGAQRFFDGFYPGLKRAIGGILTLAIIIYGVMLGFGMVEKVGRDTFVLLLKISVITWLVTSSPFVFKTVTGVMDAAAAAVVSYSPPSGAADNAGSDYNQSVCMKNMIEAQATANGAVAADKKKAIITPWLGIDCLIDSVIGIKILPAAGNTAPVGSGNWFNTTYQDSTAAIQGQGVSRGLLYFFFSNMQSSVMGMVLALVGGMFIYGLLFLIVRAFFGYIAGYMGVALLVIVSPLFIPLMLFRDTKQYFDKWAKMLIGFSMQPLLMMVFIIFSMTAVDLAAFSGNYSIMYTIAGEESRKAPFSLNDYLTKNRTKDGAPLAQGAPPCADCKAIIVNKERELGAIKTTPPSANADFITPLAARDLGGVADNLAYSQCTEERLRGLAADNPLKKACNAQYKVRAGLKEVDWALLAAAHKPPLQGVPATGTSEEQRAAAGQKIARQVIASIFFCVMVVFVLNGILAIVPRLVNDLLGDAGQSANLNDLFSQNFGNQKSMGFEGLASRVTSPLTRGR